MNNVITLPMDMEKVKFSALRFKNLLSACTMCISYTPRDDELNPVICPYIPQTRFLEYTPPTPHIPPTDYAHTLLKKHGRAISAYILIPGQEFDIHGTRHGRGYGWYDRFLSELPCHWIRIGMTPANRFYTKKLFRAHHDESMDFIIIFNNTKWEVIKTHARILNL